MGNLRGLGFHMIFVCVFLVAATYTGVLGDQNTSEHVKERLALLKFKHSVKDSYGMLSSWVGNNCCVWEGIHCDAITGNVESLHLIGNFPTADRFVQSFYLEGNEVNSSLAELKHLKHLDLSGNTFPGSHIPKFIGSFKQLTYLNLSNAGFGGNISHHIGNLSNLKVLDLTSDHLMVDDMAWISGLSSLELLDLSKVDLSRALNRGMVFYMIPSLQVLRLSYCGLSNVDLPSFRNSSRILPNIKHLDLGFNSFQGPLPDFFLNMSSLTFLDLSFFYLSFTQKFANLLSMIPSLSELHLSNCGVDKTHLSSPLLNFSTLSNIQHLDLSHNSIGRTFPSIFINMSSLRVLDLSGNMLSSSVPFMPNLLNLDLSFNQFKHIEDVGIWRQCHLKRLDASSDQFEKDVTDSPKNVSECSQYALEWLRLSGNLNGAIPKALGRLHNLRILDLSGSSLTGFIPESLGGLRYLEVLDLSLNKLTGPIPTFHGNLSKLILSYNHLNGSIPKSIGNHVALTHLDLSSNRLKGPIPTSIGRLVSLQVFSVAGNMLSGTIPFTIGRLVKLQSLDFSNNSLEGVVSEAHFGNLSMLKELDASFNTNLTFNASHEWILPCQLVSLDLTSCNIANGFPQWLRNQRELVSLYLSNASISGSLPTWLRKMPLIPYLDLSHNNLSGPLTNLPNGATYGFNAQFFLTLQYNSFNESIPRSLCKRTDLQYLDFSNNRLKGTIPECLANLQSLHNLILSSNHLSGVIPSFKGAISLRRLKLQDNNFVGKLPREFGNLTQLNILDVGENKLSGNIPEWIGETLKHLLVLRLHKNNFTGRIPESLCKASYLHVLDVAHNDLKGPIPRCLAVGELEVIVYSDFWDDFLHANKDKGQGMTQVMKGVDLEYTKTWKMVYTMDLSSNKLVGEIPVELTALSMLISLNLSDNHLNGSIPNNIGNLMKLESLDLSGNQLTGLIPQSMADLTFLSRLNLSYNNLSGRIPTGYQLQTLTDPSIYEGNKDLCGSPLSNNCSNPQDPTTTSKKKHKGVDALNNLWLFYLDVISGFATGFWGVIGVLVLKKQWRHNLFRSAEEIFDKIYVIFVVGVAKIKRRREAA